MHNPRTDRNAFIRETLLDSAETQKKILDHCTSDINKAVDMLVSAFSNGKKLLLCGNGGSAADAQHMATELVIRLSHEFKRPALPAIALSTDSSNLTAGGNDIGFENTFARSVEALGNEGDVLIGISTSGNSENVLRAIKKAKEKRLQVIGLLGSGGGRIKELCDVSIVVPSHHIGRIQEGHITIGHIVCGLVEIELFE